MLACDPHVFIPSRGRSDLVEKMSAYWLNDYFNVTYVVEPHDLEEYSIAVEKLEAGFEKERLAIKVHPIPKDDQGIGYARHHCVIAAASYGYKSIMLCDDDFKPGKISNFDTMVEIAQNPKVMGITARYGYHDLALGPGIRGRDDLVLMPTGSQAVVALNIHNVMELGNYDKELDYAEDCDLFLRTLKAGIPWMIHLGASAVSVGVRYAPGGMADYAGDKEALAAKKGDWHNAIHDKWPEFTNAHTEKCLGKQNCIRMGWRKAYDTLIPEWREWSALHGGDIEVYFDQ